MGQFRSVAVQFDGLSETVLADSRADLLIVESAIASGGQTLTATELSRLAAGGQTVIAYVNTSVTDASRSYWQDAWVDAPDPAEKDVGDITDAAPAWLRDNLGGVDFYPDHAGADAVIVNYRNSDWRDMVIAGAVAQVNAGYGGVFLDDVGRYYEAGHYGPGPFDPTLADAMMQLVIDVAAAVRAVDPDAIIIVNSGVYIGGDSTAGTNGTLFTDYLAAIDGVLIENQFNTGSNAVLEAARDLYPGKDVIALESLARAPDVGALLDYAIRSGVVLQLAPDEGYDDAVTPPLLGTTGNDRLKAQSGSASTMGGGDGNDSLTGSRQSDALYGNGGRDQLQGGSGADSLTGGTGNDSLTGNAGRDVFVFTADNSGRDRVTDFEQGRDRIDLQALDVTITEVKSALHIVGGIVRLDLAPLGGAGWIDFAGETRLSAFGESDFIL